MATSTTVMVALKFTHGVVIAADSQASEPIGRVRWPVEKLESVRSYPIVVGFSGNTGIAGRARAAINERLQHPNMVDRLDRLRNNLQDCLSPFYEEIKKNNQNVPPWDNQFWSINLHGLIACWADDNPHIVEFDPSGDNDLHQYFHAIGSGSNTAYAIYRTLGGSELVKLDERKALWVVLRILRTCVGVEMTGVSGPFYAWVVSERGARKLSDEERDAHLQLIDEWEGKSLSMLFDSG